MQPGTFVHFYEGLGWALLHWSLLTLKTDSPPSSSFCKSLSLSRRGPVTLPPAWLIGWQIVKWIGRCGKIQLHAHQLGLQGLLLTLQGTSDMCSWTLQEKVFFFSSLLRWKLRKLILKSFIFLNTLVYVSRAIDSSIVTFSLSPQILLIHIFIVIWKYFPFSLFLIHG